MATINILTIGLLKEDQPSVIDKLNNGQGTVLYNHNIKEVFVKTDEHGAILEISENEKTGSKKMYQYDSVRVEYPLTANNIFATLLTAKYSSNTESKLINEYQSAVFGILPKSAKKPYEDYLKERLAISEMIDNDCKVLGIPNE